MVIIMLIVTNIPPYYVSQSINFIWPDWPYTRTIIFCTSCYLLSAFITISTLDYTKQRDGTQWLGALPASFSI